MGFFENTRRPKGFGGKVMVKMMNSGHRKLARWGFSQISVNENAKILDKTTPRLIQFHTLKNAVNPPFLGGFSIFNTVVA